MTERVHEKELQIDYDDDVYDEVYCQECGGCTTHFKTWNNLWKCAICGTERK